VDEGEGDVCYNMHCDRCLLKKLIKAELFVCLECAGRTLCEECRAKCEAGSMEIRGCVGHGVFRVGGRLWRGSGAEGLGLVDERGWVVEEWLRFLKGRYYGIGAPTEPSLGRFFGNPQPDPGHILGHPRRYGRLRRR
jgi:hypothetical protein